MLAAAGAVVAAASASTGGGIFSKNPQLLVRQGMQKFRNDDVEVRAMIISSGSLLRSEPTRRAVVRQLGVHGAPSPVNGRGPL
jgi:hypothetical protein